MAIKTSQTRPYDFQALFKPLLSLLKVLKLRNVKVDISCKNTFY